MAMNWACISVGNPGNGAVERLTPRKPPSAFTNPPPPTSSPTTPARPQPSSTASIDSLWAPASSTPPPVIAAEPAYLSASIHTAYPPSVAPASPPNPYTVSTPVLLPPIFPPHGTQP